VGGHKDNVAFRVNPIEQTFTLDKTDAHYGNEQGSTTVTIRQASQEAAETIDQLYALVKRRYSDDVPGEVVVEQKLSIQTLRRTQAFHTLVSSNIEDEKGKLLFTEKVTCCEDKFKAAFGALPTDVVDEIMECVYKVNLKWGPEGNEF
jgi:hypothetical protein